MVGTFKVRIFTIALGGSLFAACACSLFTRIDMPNARLLLAASHRYLAPRWSPDGTQIAFYEDDVGGEGSLYLMRIDGKPRLIGGTDESNKDPDWSPEGSRIVFASGRTGSYQLYVMDLAGSNVTQLTRLQYEASAPRWSPDGRHIAFSGDRGAGDSLQIYTMSSEGSDIVEITHPPIGHIIHFEWSPDSASIVFSAIDLDANRRNAPAVEVGPFLYIMDADGRNVRRLLPSISGADFPTWSPNGAQILFRYWNVTNHERPDGLYLVNADESGLRHIYDGSSCDDLNWSRTTNQLLFVCGKREINSHIFALDMGHYVK